MENKPNRIIWHHSADLYNGHQANKINQYHKKRGFTKSIFGYHGGYHFLVEKDGSVFQFRTEEEIGCHDKGENINSLGICLAGNFNVEWPNEMQQKALADLLENLLAEWKIPISRIEPHRFGDTTDCPGTNLPDNWAQVVYLQNKINWLKRLILWLGQQIAKL